MTIEEAGELILRGEVWVPCSTCNGVMGCLDCSAQRYFMLTDVKEAYALLGLKVPDKPVIPPLEFVKTMDRVNAIVDVELPIHDEIQITVKL